MSLSDSYGNSEGHPGAAGLKRDADAALAFLRGRSDIDPLKIIVFGRSLGGAVAIDLAARQQLFAVIVENTFVCIDEMVVVLAARLGLKQSSWLRFPLAFFIARSRFRLATSKHCLMSDVYSHWNSGECIGRIKSPLLLISGLQDELIPPGAFNEFHLLFLTNSRRTHERIVRGCHVVDEETHPQVRRWTQ